MRLSARHTLAKYRLKNEIFPRRDFDPRTHAMARHFSNR
jgi:hypothetical protein